MAETIIRTSECAWSHVSMQFLGRKLTGLRSFELKKTTEKEHIYGSGSDPVDILSGNNKYEGSVKVLKYEVDMFNDAALAAGYSDITEVPHTLIAIDVQFKKSATDKIRHISVPGVAITELAISMEQGAKMTEVTLPFLAMKILHLSK